MELKPSSSDVIDKIVDELSPDQKKAVFSPARYLRIVAAAGAGKTETITRRIVYLIASGQEPKSIVAFTFTERAAREMKARIYKRVETLLGPEPCKKLGEMHIDTIHAFAPACYRISLDTVTTMSWTKTRRWRSFFATAGF